MLQLTRVACSRLSGHIRPPKRVYFTLQQSGIKLVRPLSTVDNTRDYARVSHSRQWSNYYITGLGALILPMQDFCLRRPITIERFVFSFNLVNVLNA